MVRKWLIGFILSFPGVVLAHNCSLWAPILTDDVVVVFKYDSPNTKPDADCDGLSDEEERRIGTNPYDYDTDNDGYSDYDDNYPLNPSKGKDVYPPTIKMVSGATVMVSLYTPYDGSDVSAVDDRDGSVNVSVSGRVDSFVPGTYHIVYTATDSMGNRATAVRTVIVQNKVEPVVQQDASDIRDDYGDTSSGTVKEFLHAFVSGNRSRVEELVRYDPRILSILYGNSGATDFLKGLYRTVYSIKSVSHGKGSATVIIGFVQTKDKSRHQGGFELAVMRDKDGHPRWTITWFY